MIVLRYLVFNILLMLSALSQAAVSLNNSTWDMIGPYSDRSLGYTVLKKDGNFFSFKKSMLGSQLVNGTWKYEKGKLKLEQSIGRYLVADTLISRDNYFKPSMIELSVEGDDFKGEELTLKPRAKKEKFVKIQDRSQSNQLMQDYYAEECNSYVTSGLYEPALLSCYNAFKLGKKELGSVLYALGKNGYFDEATSNNLMREYSGHKITKNTQTMVVNLKFAAQQEQVSKGSIFGNWCLDKDMYHGTEFGSLDGYERLVLNPSGEFLQVTGGMLKGRYSYKNDTLSLGDSSYSKYKIESLNANELTLKNSSWKNGQTYSRQACTKLGLQRFMQAIVKNMSTSYCDGLNNYLGSHLLPAHYFPKTVLNNLKQDPKRYKCSQLIPSVLAAYKAHRPTSFPPNQTFTEAVISQNYQRIKILLKEKDNKLIDDEKINGVSAIDYAIAEQDDDLASLLLINYSLAEKKLFGKFSEAKGLKKTQTVIAKKGLTPLVKEWGTSILVMLDSDIEGLEILMSVQKDIKQYSDVIQKSVFKVAESKSKNIDAYVKVMQKYNFDIQERNDKGQSLAMVTALAGGFTYLDSLLTQGFSLDDKDAKGLTTKSYILMCDYGNRYVEKYFKINSLSQSEAQAALDRAFRDNNLQTFYGILKAFPGLKIDKGYWSKVGSKPEAFANLMIVHKSTPLTFDNEHENWIVNAWQQEKTSIFNVLLASQHRATENHKFPLIALHEGEELLDRLALMGYRMASPVKNGSTLEAYIKENTYEEEEQPAFSLVYKPELKESLLASAPTNCGRNSPDRSYVGRWEDSDSGVKYDFSENGTFTKEQFGREVKGSWKTAICGLELSYDGVDGYVYEPVKSHTETEIVGEFVLGRSELLEVATTED